MLEPTTATSIRAVLLSVLLMFSVIAVGPIVGPSTATDHADAEFEQFSIVADQPTNGDLDISWRIIGSDANSVHRVELRFLDTDSKLVHNQHGEFDATGTGDGGDVEVADVLDAAIVWSDIPGGKFGDVSDAEVRVYDSSDTVVLEEFFADLNGIDEIELDGLDTSDGPATSDPGVFDQPIIVDDNVSVSGGPYTRGNASIDGGFDAANDRLAVADAGDTSAFESITYDQDRGILTISPLGGDASGAAFEQLFRNVTYSNVAERPDTTEREITFSLTSNADTGSAAVYNPRTGHWYGHVDAQGISWENARTSAGNKGGYLATIRNEEENAFIRDKVRRAGWIGATDAAVEGEWHWVTGDAGDADTSSDLKGVEFFDQTAAHVAWTDPYPAPPEGVPGGGDAVNGEYENWNPRHEPDNKFPFRGGEDYTYFCYETAGNCHDGMWRDAAVGSPNFDSAGYIVEYDEDPVADVAKVLTASRNVTYVADPATAAPTAVAAVNESVIDQDGMVEFDASGSTADGDATLVGWEWDVTGNGQVDLAGETVTYTFDQPGDYTVTLTVTDDNGKTDTDTVAVEVRSVEPPVVVISGPDSALRGESIQFDGTNSTDDVGIESFEWDFGDGSSTTTDVSPVHGYDEVGTYTVALTVTDLAGNTNSTTHTIEITESPLPRITDFTLSNPADRDLTVSITANQSLDHITVEILDTDEITPSPDDSVALLFTLTDSDFAQAVDGWNFTYTNTSSDRESGRYTARLTRAENSTTGDAGTGQEATVSLTSDSTAPAFAAGYPTTQNTTMNSFDIVVKANESESASWVVVADGSGEPTTIQIKNGQDSGGDTAAASGTGAITADTETSFTASGLSENTAYNVYVVLEDAAGNTRLSSMIEVSTADGSGPALSSASVTDATDGNSVVKTGDQIAISVTATDPDGVDAVTADVSAFGAGSSVSLTDEEGDDTYDVTVTVGANGTPAEGDQSVIITATNTNDNTNTTTTGTLEVDTTAPALEGVTGPLDGEYHVGETLAFTVEYDEAAEVSGTPSLALDVGGSTESAELTGGSGTQSLTFEYTVRAGDSDSDGIGFASMSIDLDGGSLTDAAGNDAATDFSVDAPDVSGVTISTDTSAPTIDGASLAADNSYVEITFSEGVYTGADGTGALTTGDFSYSFAKNGGAATDVTIESVKTASDDSLAGGETTVRVFLSVTDGPAAGEETVAITPVDGVAIYDEAGNGLDSSETTGTLPLNDRLAPTVSSVSLTNDGSDNLAVSVEVDEQLGGATSAIAVSVDGPDTDRVYTFDRSDFGESESDGSYTYTLTTEQAFDDGDGTYTATLEVARDAAGNNGAGGTSGSATATVTVAAGGADTVEIVTEPETTTAGTAIGGPPTANVTDALGKPVAGVNVTVSVNGTIANGTTTRATNGDGLASFPDLVIETAGAYVMTFDAEGVNEDASSEGFTVVADDAVTLSIVDLPERIDAGDGFTLGINATDAFGNPAADQTLDNVTVTSEHDGELFQQTAITFDGVGQYTAAIGPGSITTADEAHTITVDAEGVAAVTGDVTVTAGDGASIEAVVIDEDAIADGIDEVAINVSIADAFGNPVNGTAVAVTDPDDLSALDGASTTTDAAGNATFTASSTDTGEFEVTFSEADAGSATATATFHAGGPATLSVSTVTGTAVANDSDELEFMVTVEDRDGNPVVGITVNATDDGSDVSYTGDGRQQVTNASGAVTFTATSPRAEPVEFTFEEGTNQNGATAAGTFAPGPVDATASSVGADPDTVVANGTDASTITVVLRDTEGNAIPELADAIEVSAGAAANDSVREAGDGTYTFDLTHTVAENVTVTLTVAGVTLDQTPTVEFASEARAHFAVSVVEGPSNVTEGTPIEVTVSVENVGDAAGIQPVRLTDFAGHEVDTETVSLAPGEREQLTLTWSTVIGDSGVGTLTVATENRSVTTDTVEIGQATASFSVTITDTTDPITEGESVTVDVTVENVGTANGTRTVTLAVDGYGVVDSVSVDDLAPGDSTPITLKWETALGDANETIGVTVNSRNDTDTAAVTVKSALASVTVALGEATLERGETTQATVSATYTNGTTQTVTQAAALTSSDAGIVTVDDDGVMTAVGDGTATVSASFEGRTDSVSVSVATPSPVVPAGAFVVTNPDGRNVSVSFNSSKALDSIAVNVTIDGGNATVLTGDAFTETTTPDGNYTYAATLEGGSDGVYRATLETARDEHGLDGADGQTDAVTVDTTAPTIDPASFQLTNPSGFDLTISFSSDEKLDEIVVNVTGSGGTVIASLNETDFGDAAGTYTYSATLNASDHGADRFTATLETAADTAGNDGANGHADSATVGVLPTVIAHAAASSYVIEVGSIEFDASDSTVPDGVAATYEWDFDDGAAATGETVSHTFATPGVRNVTLTVTAAGNTSTDTLSIQVRDTEPPTAKLEVDDAVDVGTAAVFDASNSTDTVAIESYEWNFGDGTTDEDGDATATRTYADPGRYTVSVTVTDTSGNVDTATAQLLVRGPNATVPTDAITFPDVAVNSSNTAAVLVTNDGTVPLNVTGAAITGANASAFELVGEPATTRPIVRPGETRAVPVAFSPERVGDQTARLELSTNDTRRSSITVEMSGTGVEAHLDASVMSLAFNDTDVGSRHEGRIVSFASVGTASVDIAAIRIDGGNADQFTIDSGGQPSTVTPGDVHRVVVGFAPTAPGDQRANLEVETTAGTVSSVPLYGTGVGPAIHLEMASITFVPIGASDTAVATTRVSNYGNRDLYITEYALAGADGEQFAVENAPETIVPGATEPLTVTFSPDAAGKSNGTLAVTSNDPVTPVRTIALDGEAVGATIGIDERTLNFGNVTVGQTVRMNLTVRNHQRSPTDLTVTGTQLVGMHPDNFSITRGDAPFTLAPGESHDIQLSFTPLTTGVKQAQLQILSDAENDPQLDVWLSNTRTYIIVQEVGNPTINVDARNVAPNDNLIINVSRPRTRSGAVGFKELAMTVVPGGRFEIDVDHTVAPTSGGESYDGADDDVLQYVRLHHSEPDPDATYANTVVRFQVDRATIEDGIDPADVTLRRWSGGQWNTLTTRFVWASPTHYHYEVDTPGFSQFVVTAPSDDDSEGRRARSTTSKSADFTVTDFTTSSATVLVDEAVAFEAFVSNEGNAAGEFIATLTANGEVLASRSVQLEAGAATTVRFTESFPTPGTYAMRLSDVVDTTLSVRAPDAGQDNRASDGAGDGGSIGTADEAPPDGEQSRVVESPPRRNCSLFGLDLGWYLVCWYWWVLPAIVVVCLGAVYFGFRRFRRDNG